MWWHLRSEISCLWFVVAIAQSTITRTCDGLCTRSLRLAKVSALKDWSDALIISVVKRINNQISRCFLLEKGTHSRFGLEELWVYAASCITLVPWEVILAELQFLLLVLLFCYFWQPAMLKDVWHVGFRIDVQCGFVQIGFDRGMVDLDVLRGCEAVWKRRSAIKV